MQSEFLSLQVNVNVKGFLCVLPTPQLLAI